MTFGKRLILSGGKILNDDRKDPKAPYLHMKEASLALDGKVFTWRNWMEPEESRMPGNRTIWNTCKAWTRSDSISLRAQLI